MREMMVRGKRRGKGRERNRPRESSPWLFLGIFATGKVVIHAGMVTVTGSGARENDRLVIFPPTVTPSTRVGLPADPRCPNDSVCSGSG